MEHLGIPLDQFGMRGWLRALLPALFVRLVRLGETGGVLRRLASVLRRLASKEEFDDARYALAQKLVSDDYGRLLLVGEGQRAESVKIEVCHEALITQWPWLQNTLNAAAADLRALELLMDRAGRWRNAPEAERDKYLATGAERELFAEFRERRDPWLSAAERKFVAESDAAHAREEQAKRDAQEKLEQREAEARHNQSAALAALSNVALTVSPTRAVKLALAAWPRSSKDRTPKLNVALNAERRRRGIAGAKDFPRTQQCSLQRRLLAGRHASLPPQGTAPRGCGTPPPARTSPSCADTTVALQRRLLAGRRARRHRLTGQDRAAVGRRHRQGRRYPAVAPAPRA